MGDDIDERAIFVQGPVVIFRWRNASGWPVEYASPNAREVFGYSPDEFMRGEVGYGALIHPDDVERVGREVAERTASGAVTWGHERYRVRHRDGSVRWLYDYTRVLRDSSGAATHYLGYVIDITERVAAEEAARDLERQLLHAQKLESLGLLAGGVAHDFNNILTGILGQASLARRALQSVPSGFVDALEQIEQLTRRAADLTGQLLAYSGKGNVVIAPLDVSELVTEVRSMLAVVVPKQAELRLEIAPQLPPIMGDRTQLQQVVMNLITNAAESLIDGVGTVCIRARVEECGVERLADRYRAPQMEPGTYVVIEVVDDGIGMDPTVQAKMFDPFFTTKGAGRGLGMSAVLGIARAHRGAVRVDSTPARGTTFTVLLPATASPIVVAPPPAPPALAHRRRGTVLVVDDEPIIRSTLVSTLQFLGYQALAAGDGAQALTLFDRHVDDVVLALVDMTMPVLSGPATARALHARAPQLPIIMTSGFSEGEAISRITDVDISRFLQKPFGLDELAGALTAALGT